MSETFTLDKAAIGNELEVVGVHAEGAPEDWEIWLEEIGFTAGEPLWAAIRSRSASASRRLR